MECGSDSRPARRAPTSPAPCRTRASAFKPCEEICRSPERSILSGSPAALMASRVGQALLYGMTPADAPTTTMSFLAIEIAVQF